MEAKLGMQETIKIRDLFNWKISNYFSDNLKSNNETTAGPSLLTI